MHCKSNEMHHIQKIIKPFIWLHTEHTQIHIKWHDTKQFNQACTVKQNTTQTPADLGADPERFRKGCRWYKRQGEGIWHQTYWEHGKSQIYSRAVKFPRCVCESLQNKNTHIYMSRVSVGSLTILPSMQRAFMTTGWWGHPETSPCPPSLALLLERERERFT